jgi:serine/threonine protein kinase
MDNLRISNIIQNEARVTSSSGDNYRIIQFLGAGGNCQVYLAMATKGKWRGVLFAIKFFMKSADKERLAQFNKEKEFLMKTDHPSIMKIYSDGEYYIPAQDVKVPFVICDYFPDRLDYRLRNNRLGLSEKLIYITQLLSALQYLSDQTPSIVHRDIKPANIFLKGYTCVLGDFGLMRDLSGELRDEDGEFLKHSKGPGMPKYYRTPDLVKYAKGEASLTPASDVFQLGLVSAEMFTGKNPLKRSNEILDPVDVDTLQNVAGQSGELIKDLVHKMLVFDPNNRSSIDDLLDGFDGVLRQTTSKQIEIDGFAF